MIARVTIQLTTPITIPDNEQFSLQNFDYEGYIVEILPPVSKSEKVDGAYTLTVDGKGSYSADLLVINFHKETFSREAQSEHTPSLELIEDISSDFLNRLRHVVKASQIKPISRSKNDIKIEYLNDDYTALPDTKGLVKRWGTKNIKLEFVALTQGVWNDVCKVPPFEELPIWKTLLFDAEAILPEVGPSVILTFTALEVFIAKTLNQMASFRDIDDQLWSWLNERQGKNPTITEQYDSLAKQLIGCSLKEENELWKAFDNLRKARNSFAHRGTTELNGTRLTTVDALEFIKSANSIIGYIKEKLPEDLKWKEYNHEVTVNATFPFDLPV